MLQRALLIALGLPIAAFALWGALAIARQIPDAPQAAVGALAFAAIGLVCLAGTLLAVGAHRREG